MFVPYASEQNRMVQTKRNFELFDKKQKNKKTKKQKKRVFQNHFWQRVDAVLEDVSIAKIIV